MIFLENNTDFALELDPLAVMAATQTDRDLELQLVDEDTIRKLNRTYRKIDRFTDVLSFPLSDEHPDILLGTIVISIDHARTESRRLGHTIQEEIQLLFLHGLLHLLGYDHEIDAGQMRHKEHELVRQFDLPESLIIRTEDI